MLQQNSVSGAWFRGDHEQESVYKTICSNLHYRGQQTQAKQRGSQHILQNQNVNWFGESNYALKFSFDLRFSNAPLRMHRICVLGPCASGRMKITGSASR